MTAISERKFLFDGKHGYRILSVKEQRNGTFIFRTELDIRKEERGMSDAERETALSNRLRKNSRERLEGDLQIDGHILIGWYRDSDFMVPARGCVKTQNLPKFS